MNNSNDNFLTIKEAAAAVNKSESSIKRFVNRIKNETPKKYKDSKYFKFEKLKTGHQKIYINEHFLNSSFEVFNGSTMNSSSEQLEDIRASIYLKTIGILEKELDQKNKQIDELLNNQRESLERQKESNILMLGSKRTLELEEPKPKWWKRKKGR